MELRITELATDDTSQRAAWQSYVQRAPQATVFHTLAWMDAILSTYSHQARYLLAYRDHAVVGVFPLFEVRSFLTGKILVSVPYAVYGGAVCDHQLAADALLREACALARRIKAAYIDIRSVSAQWPDLPTVDRYATFSKILPSSTEQVLGTFPRKARAEVRRARDKFGLTVRFDDSQLKTVWKLYSLSMRRLGSPNAPFRFFQALVRATPDRHLLSVLYHQDRPIAGLLSLVHQDTVLPYYSGAEHEPASRMGANNYLYSTLMEKAVEMGLRRFDFGRTRIDNEGSFNFKKNQGFEPSPLGYQFYLPAGGPVPNLTPSNKSFHLAQQLWKKLPLALTRPLGGWLSSAIPG